MQFSFQTKNHRVEMEPRPAAAAAAAGRVWRFRRLMVRVSAAERLAGDGKERDGKEVERTAAEAEVGSVGLDRMVLSFMEDAAAVERPPRGRCNCFNGNGKNYDGSDDDEFDFLPSSSGPAAAAVPSSDAVETLKGLVQSASVAERNLLADASRIAERCRKQGGGGGKAKKADVRRAVADGLAALGHDAAVCKSRWDKTRSYPAGEHEYIDAVVAESESASAARRRLIVEVDFRSEFEVARPTKAYRAALQALPPLFVGTPDRLGRIVAVVAEAARQSLKKKGLHFPPWRKPEYMRAKWLSPIVLRSTDSPPSPHPPPHHPPPSPPPTPASSASFSGEFVELLFDTKSTSAGDDVVDENKITAPSPWRPVEPEVSKKTLPRPPPLPLSHGNGRVVAAGLSSVL